MRAVIYARVSSDTSGRARSVQEQLVDCRALVAREGWDAAGEFVDNDRSASRYARKGRPGFVELRATLSGGDVDVLVAWEASRLQRDLSVFVELRDLCRASGVRLCYSGAVLDFDNPDDSFRASLDAVLAERESDVTRARIMRSMRANAAAGRPHGRIPWGYRRRYSESRQLLAQEPVPEIAELILEMGRRVLAGDSCYAIANDLNARRIASPRDGKGGWSLAQVSRLLRNPTYAGKRVHKGQVIEDGGWEPIFDEVTWARLQAALDPGRRTTTRVHGVKHLLTGLAVCGVCGGRLRRTNNRGIESYSCSAPGYHVTMAMRKMDQIVTDQLLARLSRPAAAALLEAPGADPADPSRVAIGAERARLGEFIEQAASGALSAVALARVEARILARIAELEAQVARAVVPSQALDLAGTGAWDAWAGMDVGVRRGVVAALMRPVLAPGRRGSRELDAWRVDPGWV